MKVDSGSALLSKPIKASLKPAKEIAIILLSSLLVAAGLNFFLIPHQLLSGGVAGVASIIGYVSDWNISILYFLINAPLIIWGWRAVGKRYIVLSLISVVSTTWFMAMIPQVRLTKDPILAAVFGGIISAIGIGIALRAGGSTGGFDIVGSIVTRRRDIAMGNILFVMNGLVILLLGFYKSWDLALYSMLSTFVKGKVVDMIHVGHIKVTCFIITKKRDEMLCRLRKLHHGITCLHSEGGYSEERNYTLMTVTTRYELAAVRQAVTETDPKAFMNVVQSTEILGRFARPKN
ncbi:membrane protein [Paenibacillus antibioticophila]|uniref:Membrane protein n=1 Tax=Paenibacillus antibioticophila TaxID=1274374 RepID=A0A920CH83_9BACL|nr:YitT family protein [Paenibacillus antibioticophila]GIO37528.1 membrane protein [Paenibacillus antibioticophila]